jgi:hypothetical protein
MANDREDIEMLDDEYDTYMLLDPIIANEQNDFVDECILLLHLLQQKTTNSEHRVSYLRDLNDYQAKQIILYNWIALSLVTEAHADVAAVAVYRFKDKPSRVYYAKNNLKPSDQAHAKELSSKVETSCGLSSGVIISVRKTLQRQRR